MGHVPMSSHRHRAAVAAATAVAVCLVSTACGSGGSSSTSASSACIRAYRTWADGPHGMPAFQRVSTDVGIVSTDLQQVDNSHQDPRAVTATFIAGSKLRVDSDHAIESPPPSCVPGFARPYRAALSDARQAGDDVMAAMTALRAGDQSEATSSVNAFASDVGEAQVNIKAARAAAAREIHT